MDTFSMSSLVVGHAAGVVQSSLALDHIFQQSAQGPGLKTILKMLTCTSDNAEAQEWLFGALRQSMIADDNTILSTIIKVTIMATCVDINHINMIALIMMPWMVQSRGAALSKIVLDLRHLICTTRGIGKLGKILLSMMVCWELMKMQMMECASQLDVP